MSQSLRILFVEDSEDDVTLLVRFLKQGGYSFDFTRVDTLEMLRASIDENRWDVIIADYVLPKLSGLEALHFIKQRDPDIPFILVSGAIGEDIAAEAMKAGAHDYILKNNLTRLIPAIDRELKESKIRRNNRKAEAQLLYKAFYDSLTGLPNRILFQDKIAEALNTVQFLKDFSFGVMLMGIDRFKAVNESFGHEFGDKLLSEFTHRIEKCIPDGAVFARFGSDEFAILTKSSDAYQDMIHLSECIKSRLNDPFMVRNQELYLSVSIGITLYQNYYQTPEEMLRDAGAAMHTAKNLGRSRYEVFNMKMHKNSVAKVKMETDLRKGLEKGEFIPVFQPIIEMESGSVIAFEALMRWSKNGLLIPPSDFLPLAEETGVIVAMERGLILQAVKQVMDMNEEIKPNRKVAVSVNISTNQFQQQDFNAFIQTILDDLKLDPSLLIIEITENVIMKDMEYGLEVMQGFKKLGVQVFIDDFGIGYSSLSYLLRFPVDFLKIDRSFISRMSFDQKHAEIVQAVVGLASRIGLKAVAEGIETQEQMDILKSMQCEYGQGYLISKPMECEETRMFFKNNFLKKSF